MFMVASSVVSTILILNYHHRNADTHEMSDWVSLNVQVVGITQKSVTENSLELFHFCLSHEKCLTMKNLQSYSIKTS
jgi:hypothetical protein